MPKALHWGGKIYPVTQCVLCKAQNVPVVPEAVQKQFAAGTMTLVPKGLCSACVYALSEGVEKVGTALYAARSGGEYK